MARAGSQEQNLRHDKPGRSWSSKDRLRAWRGRMTTQPIRARTETVKLSLKPQSLLCSISTSCHTKRPAINDNRLAPRHWQSSTIPTRQPEAVATRGYDGNNPQVAQLGKSYDSGRDLASRPPRPIHGDNSSPAALAESKEASKTPGSTSRCRARRHSETQAPKQARRHDSVFAPTDQDSKGVSQMGRQERHRVSVQAGIGKGRTLRKQAFHTMSSDDDSR